MIDKLSVSSISVLFHTDFHDRTQFVVEISCETYVIHFMLIWNFKSLLQKSCIQIYWKRRRRKNWRVHFNKKFFFLQLLLSTLAISDTVDKEPFHLILLMFCFCTHIYAFSFSFVVWCQRIVYPYAHDNFSTVNPFKLMEI